MSAGARNALIYLTFLAWAVVTGMAVIRHHLLSPICACERSGGATDGCACFESQLQQKLKEARSSRSSTH